MNFGVLTQAFAPYSADNFTVNFDVNNKSCSYNSEPQSLEAWKENDYALVKVHRDKAIESCTKKYIEDIDAAIHKAEI